MNDMDKQNQIAVSIICNTFNHSKYIRKVLEGFISQETTFMFEVLIHDDASYDDTPEIIREFEEQYPNVIFPIYQTENQYSKHVNITHKYQFPRVRGKYIALCEGDDYWIDNKKLQKQYDAMELHPTIDLCAHAVNKIKAGKVVKCIAPRDDFAIIPVEEVIFGGGAFVGTNSLLMRSSMLNNMPQFAQIMDLDYIYQIWGSLRGGLLFLPDIMSVYNIGVEDSWSTNMDRNPEKYFAHCERVIKMLQLLNEDTEGRYKSTIETHIKEIEFSNLTVKQDYKQLLCPRYRSIFCKLPLKKRIKIYIKRLKQIMRLS